MSRMYKRNGLNHSTSSRSSPDPSTQLEMSLNCLWDHTDPFPALSTRCRLKVLAAAACRSALPSVVLVFQIESLFHRSIYFRLICLAHRLISFLVRLITGAYFPLNSTPLSESG